MKSVCEVFLEDLYQEYKQRGTIEEERGFRDSIEGGSKNRNGNNRTIMPYEG